MATIIQDLKSKLNEVLPQNLLDRVKGIELPRMQQSHSTLGTVVSGAGIFVAGMLVGGAVALLIAPKSGLELRSDLEDKLDQLLARFRGTEKEKSAEESTSSASTAPSKAEKSESGYDKKSPTPADRASMKH